MAAKATNTTNFPTTPQDHSSVGLGVDLVQIEHMRRILARTPSFMMKVFSPQEVAYCKKRAYPEVHFACRFAAKEAVLKALGTGFSQGVGVRDVEVVRTKSGKPQVSLSGRALQIAQEQNIASVLLSLSYTQNEAVACAVAISHAGNPEAMKEDIQSSMDKSFKDARKWLDSIEED